MSHPIETKNQFIELRAQGLTLDAISAQISVPTPTLGRWNQECLEQIQRLRALQWDLVEEQIGHRLEDTLKRIAQRIRRLEDELDARKPHLFPRMELMRVIRQSRLEYLKLRSILLAPLQPTRGRPCSITSLDPQKREKTRQNTDSLDTTLLQQNDLQQSEPVLSHSATPHGVPASAGAVAAESQNSHISHDSHDSHNPDESIVIDPDEPARSIAQRCGITGATFAIDPERRLANFAPTISCDH